MQDGQESVAEPDCPLSYLEPMVKIEEDEDNDAEGDHVELSEQRKTSGEPSTLNRGYEWDIDKTFKLINYYEKFPELWNCTLKEYRDRDRKAKALKEIADSMDVNELEINRKWHNLRCQMNKELRKLKKIQNEEIEGKLPRKSKWKFFDSLKFMLISVNLLENKEDCSKTFIALTNPRNSSRKIRLKNGSLEEVPKKRTRRITVDEEYLNCVVCFYRAGSARDLEKHMKSRHPGEKPFKCPDCLYRASFKSNLNRHLRKHTREKPYQCEYCEYVSSYRSSLKRHVRIHTGEKPYKCSLCPFATSDNSSLANHLSTHSEERPFQCEFCSYSASLKKNYVRHVKVHSGERPYVCALCPFSTKSSSNLIRHRKTHAREEC